MGEAQICGQIVPVQGGRQLADYKGWRAKFAADNALNYSPDELIDAVSILRDALLSTVADGVSPRIALENALIKIIPASR